MRDIDWSPWLIRMSRGDEEAFRTVYEATRDHTYRIISTLTNARASLKEVQAQLAPGETAIVYLPEVYSKFQGVPVAIGVTNPSLIADAQQWRSVMEAGGVTEPMPDSLLGGAFAFEAGTTNSPFHFQMGLDALDTLHEMKIEYKQGAEQQPLWRLTDAPADHPIAAYTSIYRDVNGEAIYLTWEVINDSSIRAESFTSPNTVYEEIDVKGQNVHYTQNDQSLYGESNVLQDVMWILEKNGQTIVYHVKSDSAGMTKEQLIEAATSLL